MKLPGGRRAHVAARPAEPPSPAWAWLFAFRRQLQQEIATILSGLDATERSSTELYTKPVEELGSDKARLRRRGLYALERLAQDNPAHRQTIVYVICAYLRMPFSPTAPTGKPEPEAAEGQQEPGGETETRTAGIGGAWHHERRVRLTAQRILEEHLRDDRDEDQQSADRLEEQQSADPLMSRFWPGIRLDLTGATLIDFSLVNGVMADANFHEASFSGDAWFDGASFGGDAWFDSACFSRGARFNDASFAGDAWFDGATFGGDASFGRATFSRGARFARAAFSGGARFGKASFGGEARFGQAAFYGDAWFGGATFGGDASFGRATFSRGARFGQAAFSRGARFGQAAFGGDAWFGEAAFNHSARFRSAVFSGDAWFGGASFGGDASFGRATFSRGARFGQAAFSRGAGFGKAIFGGHAGFDGATFTGGEDSLSFQRSRVLSSDGEHAWPTGWCLMPDGSSEFTVVRAKGDDRA